MTLRYYMDKVKGIFLECSVDFIKAANAARAARDQIPAVQNNRMLSEEGKRTQIEALRDAIKGYEAEMEQCKRKANDEARQVREAVAQAFYSRYHADVDSLDKDALQLLNSDIMTDGELMQMSMKFDGNATMQRLIAKKLVASADPNIASYGRVLLANSNEPHLAAIDNVIKLGNFCMGEGSQSGANGASGLFARFDEILAETYDKAPNISA